MPEDYAKAKYNLKRIAFDAATATFADSQETVFDASSIGKSVSFPRVSPDGRHLVFTLHGYGISIPTMSKATIPGAGIHVGWSSAAGATTDSTPDSSFRMSTVKGMHRSHFSFRRRIQGNITRICYIPTTFRNS